MCKELPTAMVLGCVLQKHSRREIPYRKLTSVSKALVEDGMLVNISYPAVKKVENLYHEIKVVARSGGFVIKKVSSKGVLFNLDHIRIAYAGGLEKDEFKKIKDVVEMAMSD